ncbi:acylamino-acid-releasing enzyme isoform X2 [Arabidopsis lyrata subsp. lyrata]|uniref:acylamino-acid-releasing enzyme isoform X2 n=1 Tax=Arabidopsis lyrata subsp. lyrata TaxID=81972 RepID=UPI000A29E867|nr:acylamino-acid-releasing enzyme isoform X2 [Arabidopsis lyrata subsp. lyrata]XP_020885859.1 acylamino-acid-releasing enzyme isoform X2 [Arabidopsis lyrata subsp. lyrata]|eukprot:XP_020885858.1 acylamino-acid-releasing enzyme isoform X2 [Arabidopsis lyrata subsp. lyrata]
MNILLYCVPFDAAVKGEVSRVSPSDLNHSWNILALDGDDIVAVCSSPVNLPEDLTEGAKKPIEAIYVSCSKSEKCDPLVVVIHGGPHSLSPTSFSNNLAYLSSIGNSLLIVNYRGSLGFGEDALQSLPGKVGSQMCSQLLITPLTWDFQMHQEYHY